MNADASRPVSAELLELAEDLNATVPLAAGDERFAFDDAVVWIGAGGAHPALTVVQRLRFGADLAERVAALRELLRAHGRREATWEVGPSARPADVASQLRALGMTPYEEPIAHMMVLRRPLPPTDSRVVARPALDLEDAISASTLLNTVFGESTETPEERRARVAATFDAYRSRGRATFLAELDGRPIAAANAIHTAAAVVLSGGATLPDARGLGAYRALVAARYEEAVRRGTPTLVIQAGAMSHPILERLGFETVGTIEILHDRF